MGDPDSSVRCVCVRSRAGVDVNVGLDGTGKGGAEKDPEDDEDEDDDEGDGDPAAVAPKIIFFGRESPKDVLKCFFLFLFLERETSSLEVLLR